MRNSVIDKTRYLVALAKDGDESALDRLRDNLDKLHADKRDIHKEVRLDNYRSITKESFAGTVGPVDYTTPSAIISKREDLARLARAIDSLKPEYREVIVQTKIEGLSYKEIADRTGKSADAVRMLVSRAITALSGAFENV